MNIILANGIRTHGATSIDLLGAELRRRGLRAIDIYLPYRSVISVRWGAKKDGNILARASHDGDIIVGHSFGALRAFHAAKDVNYRAIVCVRPAMPRDWEWDQPEIVSCIYHPDDPALKHSAKLRFAHPFGGGTGGRFGFDDPKVTNMKSRKLEHSADFYGEALMELADHVQHLTQQRNPT